MEGFTDKQVKWPQEARQLYNQLGAPTMENMKMIICHNLIDNCPVTTEDINMANRMFEPDISTFKGWYTFPKPVKVIDDLIEIPKELISRNQLLYLAIYFVLLNTQSMLTTIYVSIKYRWLVPLDDRTAEEVYRGLYNVLSHYNISEFFMKQIHCDGWFKSIMDEVINWIYLWNMQILMIILPTFRERI